MDTFDGVADFLRRSVDISPAVVLMDMRMPDLTGVEAHTRLRQMGRHTPVIYISGESSNQEVIDAMKLGVVDFLLKPVSRHLLEAAIEKGLTEDRLFSEQRRRLCQVKQGYETLSAREKEVLPFLLRGMSNKQVGEMMLVQAGTIKKYRASIFEKMNVTTTDQLIMLFAGLESNFYPD